MDFLKRRKFWILIGLLVVGSGGALAFWWQPVRAHNRAILNDFLAKKKSLSDMARKNEVPNEGWVGQAKEVGKHFRNQLHQMQLTLKGQDQRVERRFHDPTCPECEVPLDVPIWKVVYQENVEALERTLRERFVHVGGTPIKKQSFGRGWIDRNAMFSAEKDYWIQKFAIDALAALNKVGGKHVVPAFHFFRFDVRPERIVHSSHEEGFTLRPFEIQLSTEFEHIPVVTGSLLGCHPGFNITTLTIERASGGSSRRTTPKDARLAGLPKSLVQLAIRGYFADYSPAPKADKKEGAKKQ